VAEGSSAAATWRDALAAWALPESILASAEQSPWIHPPELFTVPERIEDSPSHRRAREALERGSVLDVGCGGGIAAFALAPPATLVIGVDHQPAMLEMFRANAAERGLACETFQGDWPAVAESTPVADAATAHHVVYNVGDIVPFLRALDAHARRRVVLELPDRHPLSAMTDAWRHFWRLERPEVPTPSNLLAVLEEMGVDASSEQWVGPARTPVSPEQAAHFLRIRLCLPAAREPEVLEYVRAHRAPAPRALTTIWWDTK
jgi:SAM-dependent methyltransferase